jgi:hypothetical protein
MKQVNFSNACGYGHSGGDRCMSDITYQKLKALENNINFGRPIETILKEKGKTIDELGLLLDKRVVNALGQEAILKEVNDNFKPVGPVNNELFNNFVEDNVMRSWQRWDPNFAAVPVSLMDFQDHGGPLTKIKFSKSGKVLFDDKEYTTFGCVLNTLRMAGDLSKVGHWVGLFGDFRTSDATIEYFNSSGRSAPAELWSWMEKKAKEYTQLTGHKCTPLNVSNIQHQKSNTECGIYSIFFITARLCGISYKKFRESPIADQNVNKFRKYVLNDQNALPDRSLLESHRLL